MVKYLHSRCRLPFSACLAALMVVALDRGTLLAGGAPPAKRARPPKFSKIVTDAFYPNALEQLVGPPPRRSQVGDAPVVPLSTPRAAPSTVGASLDWAQLISAEVMEDEIKVQHRKLGETVANVVQFKGGDYRRARTHLSVLAAMFAIDAEYKQPVRWQREAAAVRDRLARAGFNCKVATDASYQDAKACHDDLEILVRGGSIDLPPPEADVTWDKVADRGPLMERLDQAEKRALSPWTANAEQFAANVEGLSHEAQIVAALAAAIARDGYEYADDDTYLEYAGQLRSSAAALRDATAQSNYPKARQAVGEIQKTCSTCHEGYRN